MKFAKWERIFYGRQGMRTIRDLHHQQIASEKQKTASQVYEILKSTNCIDEYLTPFYDVLHAMSSQKSLELLCFKKEIFV